MHPFPWYVRRYFSTVGKSSITLAIIFALLGAIPVSMGVFGASAVTVQLFLNADPPAGGFLFGVLFLVAVVVLTIVATATVWLLAVMVSLLVLLPALLGWEWLAARRGTATANARLIGYVFIGVVVAAGLALLSSVAFMPMFEGAGASLVVGALVALVVSLAAIANSVILLRA